MKEVQDRERERYLEDRMKEVQDRERQHHEDRERHIRYMENVRRQNEVTFVAQLPPPSEMAVSQAPDKSMFGCAACGNETKVDDVVVHENGYGPNGHPSTYNMITGAPQGTPSLRGYP